MSVLGNKDSDGMEVVRYHTEDDPVYYTVMNRPIEDLEQRTIDLNKLGYPARGLRVTQTSPPSKSIEVAGGVYMDGDTNPLYFPQSGVGDTLGPITDCPAGFYRVDLVYFNIEAGTIHLVAGTQTNVDWPTAITLRAALPTGPNIPLAYLYVPDSATRYYVNGVSGHEPGRIWDIRLPFDGGVRVFEDTAGNILQDAAGGALGTSHKIARSGHRHEVNLDATVPETLSPDTSASVGAANAYSRSDHQHDITVETTAAGIKKDIPGGFRGSADKVARGDHQHQRQVSSTLPASCGPLGSSSAGSADEYSIADHRHAIEGLSWYYAVGNYGWTTPVFNALSSGALGFTPVFMIVVGGIVDTLAYSGPFIGVATGTGSYQAAITLTDKDGPDYNQHTVCWENGMIGGMIDKDGVQGYKFAFSKCIEVTQFNSSGIEFSWDTYTNGFSSVLSCALSMLAIGQD